MLLELFNRINAISQILNNLKPNHVYRDSTSLTKKKSILS